MSRYLLALRGCDCYAGFCRAGRRRSSISLTAAWDRDGRWAGLLGQAVRKIWPATSLPPLQPGAPTLAAITRHSKALLSACRRISRHGTMLQALCRTWSLFGHGTPRQVIGRAVPQVCPDCHAILPSRHSLAAHLHRTHGRVALSTQYTHGPVCLWCLHDFHNTDRLRYHILHSPACEHGLRCVVGPVYEYGTGSKRRGRKGHPRAPVIRVPGPMNASPAQRQAASEGRDCTAAELADELARLAPGPAFSSEARSSPVVPRPEPSDPATVSATPSQVPETVVLSQPGEPTDSAPPTSSGPIWGSFADFAQDDDWLLPSVHWHRSQPPRIWRVPNDWSTCLDLCVEVAKNVPWSAGMWRLTAPLRKEAAGGSRGPRAQTFSGASATRRLYLQRIVTFRLLLEQLQLGSAIWFPSSPKLSWLGLIRRTVPGVHSTSTIPFFGFGTLLSLPHLASGFLASLRTSGVEHSRIFRLAAPHFHCHSGSAASLDSPERRSAPPPPASS